MRCTFRFNVQPRLTSEPPPNLVDAWRSSPITYCGRTLKSNLVSTSEAAGTGRKISTCVQMTAVLPTLVPRKCITYSATLTPPPGPNAEARGGRERCATSSRRRPFRVQNLANAAGLGRRGGRAGSNASCPAGRPRESPPAAPIDGNARVSTLLVDFICIWMDR